MYLTNLADVARSAGLKVVEQPGWRTRGHGGMSGVKAVVCHHTAGAATGNAPSLGVVQDGRTGLPGPLSHFVLGRDGTVFVVAAGLAYHAGAVLNNAWSNNWSIGIEAEATGVTTWPEVQRDAFARLCKALANAFGLPTSAVLGHKEVCSPPGRKIDPNFDMGAFRNRVGSASNTPTVEDDMYSFVDLFYDNPVQEFGNFSQLLAELKDKTRAASADAAAARAELSDVKTALATLSAKVDNISVGGVDVASLAKAINDDAARRMAE